MCILLLTCSATQRVFISQNIQYCQALYCNVFSEINYCLSLTYYCLQSLLLVSNLFELSPSFLQLFSDMFRNLGNINALSLSLSIVIYGSFNFNQYIPFSFFSRPFRVGTQIIHPISDILSFYIYISIYIYIYSVRIEGCLVVTYLEKYFFWSANFTNWVCKSQHISDMGNVSFESFQYQHL